MKNALSWLVFIVYDMKTLPKGDYWGTFWNWNEDISGSKRAMNAFESAFERWECILFDAIIFGTIEYSDLNPQMKIVNMSICQKSGEIAKIKVESKIRRDNCSHFFLEEVYDDTLWKQNCGTHKWKIVGIILVELSKSRNQKSKNRDNWQYFEIWI